ncbi:hypothetical protein RFI_05191 [Reticulomyxa filosa]|uniref:Uncharacterized protein n=1 Tax=Reticulomyxa filosa TaxID=46433 RepID=X6P140_RETFI|nr:hypothetical protein RFI_05191 [Reticulomyxa filosa]|eukprot:ETO31926.1 hypothetical protein RFI_05191 [Reticulomyxa filosa]
MSEVDFSKTTRLDSESVTQRSVHPAFLVDENADLEDSEEEQKRAKGNDAGEDENRLGGSNRNVPSYGSDDENDDGHGGDSDNDAESEGESDSGNNNDNESESGSGNEHERNNSGTASLDTIGTATEANIRQEISIAEKTNRQRPKSMNKRNNNDPETPYQKRRQIKDFELEEQGHTSTLSATLSTIINHNDNDTDRDHEDITPTATSKTRTTPTLKPTQFQHDNENNNAKTRTKGKANANSTTKAWEAMDEQQRMKILLNLYHTPNVSNDISPKWNWDDAHLQE